MSSEPMSDIDLRHAFKTTWPKSIGSFIEKYNLNSGNFRQWVNGKKRSNISEAAVKKWLSEKDIPENVDDIVIKKMIGSQFQNDLLEISPDIEGIVFIDGDQALILLDRFQWLLPFIEKMAFSPIIFFCTINNMFHISRTIIEKIYRINKIYKCIYVYRSQVAYKNTVDMIISLQIGMASIYFQIYKNPKAPLFLLVTNDLFGESLAREVNDSPNKLIIIDNRGTIDMTCFLVFQLPKIVGYERVNKIIKVFSPATDAISEFFSKDPSLTYPLAPWITRESFWKIAGIYQFYDEIQIGKLDTKKISGYIEISQNEFIINLKKDLYQGKWKELDKIHLSYIQNNLNLINSFPFPVKKLKDILTLGAVEEILKCKVISIEGVSYLHKMKSSMIDLLSYRKIGSLNESELKSIWKYFWKNDIKEFSNNQNLYTRSFSGWICGIRESDFIYKNAVKKWLAENVNTLCEK